MNPPIEDGDIEENAAKKIKIDPDETEPTPIQNGLSAFELKVRQNIEDRMKMFQALNIDAIKQEVKPTVVRSKPDVSRTKRKWKVASPTIPTRKSRRIQELGNNRPVDSQQVTEESHPAIIETESPRYERKLGKLTVSECIATDDKLHLEECSDFLSSITSKTDPSVAAATDNNSYFETVCGFAAQSDDCWTRLVPKRVTSMAWSPSRHTRFLAAGDKTGTLGLWNIDGGVEATHVLQPHQQGIVHLSFSAESGDGSCFTTSYDGITRRLDVATSSFEQVFALADHELPRYTTGHALIGGSSLLVGCSDGRVFRVDRREPPPTTPDTLSLGLSGIRTLSLHPSRQHTLLLVEKPRTLSLWDLRYVKRGTSSALLRLEMPQSCHGAYLDNCDGNRVVAACMDDTVRMYSGVNAATPSLSSILTVQHNNHTGRWLTPLRPVWLPGSQCHFIIGSMNARRRIEVMNDSGRMCHLIMGDALQSVLSTVACHPTLPLVAGANSSGRVYAFQ